MGIPGSQWESESVGKLLSREHLLCQQLDKDLGGLGCFLHRDWVLTVAQSLHSSCLYLFLWHLVHQPDVETRQGDT